MDAVKFIEEARRRYKVTGKATGVLLNWLEPEYIVKEVEVWSATHQPKTRQTEFLKLWPETCLDENGAIAIPPCTLSKEYQAMTCDQYDCAECRKEFWLEPIE